MGDGGGTTSGGDVDVDVAHSHASSTTKRALLDPIAEIDSQEIRVCALVLSVLAFFLFIVAEFIPTDRSMQTIVRTLVALGTLGFAWIGPLTLLAGTIRSPKFKWWQPFHGGPEFVWMQAMGWSLHTLVLTTAFVVLVNDRMDKWVEGQYLILGVGGFAAQLLLNLSIGCFKDDHTAEMHNTMMQFPWNTKAVMSMLISGSAALLYVLFDLFAHRFQSPVLLIAGCVEFVLSAVIIHIFYGCMEIPGYRIWQPFEGERTFLLLQYLGWQFFAGTVAGSLMLISSTDYTSTFRGAPTAVGCMGVISQVILLLSLQHFTLTKHEMTREKIWRRRRRRPQEVYVSGLLCLGALALGAVSYMARQHDRAQTSTAFRIFLAHEHVLWAIGICALAMATPIVNLGAVRAYRGYHWWQPFVGGTKYVFLQTLGWLWYAFFLATSIVLILNKEELAELLAPFVLLLGCASAGAITLSISCFVSPKQATIAQHHSQSLDSLDENELLAATAAAAAAAELSYQSTIQHGEIAISLLMSISCILCHAFVDWFRDELRPSLRLIGLAFGIVLFSLACAITHASGRRIHPTFRLIQPFEGGSGFVVRQAVGWTLFATQLLVDALVMTLPTDSLPFGVATFVGMFVIIPHLILVSSIGCFKPTATTTTTSTSTTTTTTTASKSWHVIVDTSTTSTVERRHRTHTASIPTWSSLLARPDLRWRIIVNGIISVGAVLLFALAEMFRLSLRFRHADEVLYAFGCIVAVGGLLFTHCTLGPRIRPGYRFFQPFRGGLRFITFQGVAWTLASVAWVVALTAFYWRSFFFQFPGVHMLTGGLFLIAQGIMAHSIPYFQPPTTDASFVASPTVLLRSHWSKLDKFAHEFFVGPLLGMAACVVFVLVDIAMIYCGPTLPVFPITVCAVFALFSAIPMSYKFARSSMRAHAKAMGGSVVFIVLGSALWSFTILLGAVFCWRVWGMEGVESDLAAGSSSTSSSSTAASTNFMGTFTGSVGFIAQFVFFQASDMKAKVMTMATGSSPRSAAKRTAQSIHQAKAHLLSVAKVSYSMVAIATTLAYAYSTSLMPRQLPTHQVLGMAVTSMVVVASACYMQRQIVTSDGPKGSSSSTSTSASSSSLTHDAFRTDTNLLHMEAECFSQVAAFLTIAELVRLSSTCRTLHHVQSDAFWRRQFIERFSFVHFTKQQRELFAADGQSCVQLHQRATIVKPFASSWLYSLQSLVLNAICRLQEPFVHEEPLPVSHVRSSSKWKTLCISKENDCWSEQCYICRKLEILSHTSRQWERRQDCAMRVPSTWVRLCSCVNPETLGHEVAHRACLESMLNRPHRGPGVTHVACSRCGSGVQLSSTRYPLTIMELLRVTWADFASGRDDFGEGFFAIVPMSSSGIILATRSFSFGCLALYVWVCFAMALCFVANTPRIQRCLERVGTQATPSYLAHLRVINTLALSSLAHVLWCMSARPFVVVDLAMRLNFVCFIAMSTVLLVIYWQTNYRVPTVRAMAIDESTDPHQLHPPVDWTPNDDSCVLCLLQICTEDDRQV